LRVAIQGERGSFSEEAARLALGADIAVETCRDLAQVFQRLRDGEADAAVVPVENSRTGTVVDAYEELLTSPLPVRGEVDLPVHQCLLALPGARLEDLRQVYSHPQALSQCRDFLRRLQLAEIPWYDTAGSARHVAALGRPDVAALAPRRAAELYGLAVLAEAVEDAPDNTTRFYVVGQPPIRPMPRRSILAFAIQHRPGALLAALTPLAEAGVNLAKLESRPSRERPFEYIFFAVADARADEPAMAKALARLESVTVWLRLLGTYGDPGAPDPGGV
jgi:prephenate dehydratase